MTFSQRRSSATHIWTTTRRAKPLRARKALGVSERRACRVLGHPRSTQRYEPMPSDHEQDLTADIVELATRFGRYGYRRITATQPPQA